MIFVKVWRDCLHMNFMVYKSKVSKNADILLSSSTIQSDLKCFELFEGNIYAAGFAKGKYVCVCVW